MSDPARLEELRRRVERDPASIAFAQLAEEYRRAGRYQDAIDVCRSGLARHPAYLSVRVTLGRALLHAGQLDDAQHELELVLNSAPSNLAALRALAEVQQRRGVLNEAIELYQRALQLAPNDPELERNISEVSDALRRSANARENQRALAVVAALEHWLAAVHATRTQRSA